MYVGCYARDIIKYLKKREVNTIFIVNYESENKFTMY